MEIKGEVADIIYQNEINSYTISTFETEDELVTIVGYLPFITSGDTLKLFGKFVEHKDYGRQFKVDTFEKIMPETLSALEKYLGNGNVKGIGEVTARKIIRKFGDDTINIFKFEPERLAEIKGITKAKALEMSQSFLENWEVWQIVGFLERFKIGAEHAKKVYNLLGVNAIEQIEGNPYILIDIARGVDFKQIDAMALDLGISYDNQKRVESGIKYALIKATYNGHSCVVKENLIEFVITLLDVTTECIEDNLIGLKAKDEIVIEKRDGVEWIYLYNFYKVEEEIATRIIRLDNSKNMKKIEHIDKALKKVEEKSKMELSEKQKEAIKAINEKNVTIITGGPGTGKTTIIKTIIDLYEEKNKKVVLAAPTGRAAKRMNEATGHEAKTIHRLLEISGGASEETGRDEIDAKFGRNEQNPLETDVIIVDEMSMVDTFLVHALLKAITIGTRVVFVGDINQLASVGPGNVLRDIIESEQFSVVRLTKVFRQAGESGIVTNAHKINKGEQVALDNSMGDFLYIERENAQMALNATIGLMMSKLPQYVEAKPMDIQVLTPMRGGILGVNSLNEQLQKYINPQDENKREREIAGIIFREGDKVMQIKNNYQLEWEQRSEGGRIYDSGTGIFNGDMGIITTINNTTNTMEVVFDDDRYVIYDSKQAEELELAYAITIHKSQGSEYPAVIMPLVSGVSMLMTRNLLYTGVTRAKKCVCIVGRKETFSAMIANEDQHRRYSGLKWQLVNYYNEEQ